MPTSRVATKAKIRYVNYSLFDIPEDALPVPIAKETVCSICGENVPGGSYECPNCGVLIKDVPDLPAIEGSFAWEVVSKNYNGVYRIYRLKDGTPVCNCKSFLFQRGVQADESGFIVCKHMKGEVMVMPANGFQKLHPWQEIILKKLGVTPAEGLSSEQANFIIEKILSQIGIDYHEFVDLAKSNPSYELLPLYSFGVELEGLIRNREEMKEKLEENNIKAVVTGYSHAMQNGIWRVGDDGSVRRNMSVEEQRDFRSMELTSPKLWGKAGFDEIKKVLAIWNSVGGAVNASCGFHVHVDAWDYSRDELGRLALVWAKIEPIVYYMVSKSRRRNTYCCWLRRSPQNVNGVIDPFTLRVSVNRYCAINFDAFNHYKTIEFRIHQGTMNPDKIINWIIFCLKLTQKVKEGLKHSHFSDNPTIEEVLDRLGIVNNSIPMIRKCREFLLARYKKFATEAEQEENTPSVFTNYNDFLNEIREGVQGRINMLFGDRHLKTYFPTINLNFFPSNHVKSLFYTTPSRRITISYENVIQLIDEATDGVINFPSLSSESSGRVYQVRYDSESETITCNCRAFRTHGRCLHAIAVARAMYLRDTLEKTKNLDF